MPATWNELVERVEALEAKFELKPVVSEPPVEEPIDEEDRWRRRLEIVAIGGAEGHPDLVEARQHVFDVRALFGSSANPMEILREQVSARKRAA